jgi:hypothetical protein
VLEWLNIRDYTQEDHIDDIHATCHHGTTNWFFAHPSYKTWLVGGAGSRLWVHGIPGSGKTIILSLDRAKLTRLGKSVLCSQVIYELRSTANVVAHYVHDYSRPDPTTSESEKSSRIMRSLVSQIVRQRRDLAGFVYNDYVLKGLEASFRVLTNLMIDLVSGNSDVSIVIDGLDECMDKEVKKLLDLIRKLLDVIPPTRCRVIIFSRSSTVIQRNLKKWPSVALREEKKAVDSAISLWLHAKFQDLQSEHEDLLHSISPADMLEIEREVVVKADGTLSQLCSTCHACADVRDRYVFVGQIVAIHTRACTFRL